MRVLSPHLSATTSEQDKATEGGEDEVCFGAGSVEEKRGNGKSIGPLLCPLLCLITRGYWSFCPLKRLENLEGHKKFELRLNITKHEWIQAAETQEVLGFHWQFWCVLLYVSQVSKTRLSKEIPWGLQSRLNWSIFFCIKTPSLGVSPSFSRKNPEETPCHRTGGGEACPDHRRADDVVDQPRMESLDPKIHRSLVSWCTNGTEWYIDSN